ncbi:hypothetical protein SUGI_0978560 [Cryptomeria japonica]|nr:hypothetical protein SUGI_0978560 [Cryptomeria japonica]
MEKAHDDANVSPPVHKNHAPIIVKLDSLSKKINRAINGEGNVSPDPVKIANSGNPNEVPTMRSLPPILQFRKP